MCYQLFYSIFWIGIIIRVSSVQIRLPLTQYVKFKGFFKPFFYFTPSVLILPTLAVLVQIWCSNSQQILIKQSKKTLFRSCSFKVSFIRSCSKSIFFFLELHQICTNTETVIVRYLSKIDLESDSLRYNMRIVNPLLWLIRFFDNLSFFIKAKLRGI